MSAESGQAAAAAAAAAGSGASAAEAGDNASRAMAPHLVGAHSGGPIDCADALTRVYLYLDGEIDAGTSAEARAHLEECVPCLREYGLEEEVKRLVRRSCGGDEVPSGLRDRVLVRLHQVTITLRYD